MQSKFEDLESNLEDLSFSFINILKLLLCYVKQLIMNVWEAMQQDIADFEQKK